MVSCGEEDEHRGGPTALGYRADGSVSAHSGQEAPGHDEGSGTGGDGPAAAEGGWDEDLMAGHRAEGAAPNGWRNGFAADRGGPSDRTSDGAAAGRSYPPASVKSGQTTAVSSGSTSLPCGSARSDAYRGKPADFTNEGEAGAGRGWWEALGVPDTDSGVGSHRQLDLDDREDVTATVRGPAAGRL